VDRMRFMLDHSNREALALPSRSAALASVQESVSSGCRVILITGEAGVGKTWLLRSVIRSLGLGRSWLWVDAGPTTTPGELMVDLAHQIGCEVRPSESVSFLMRVVRERLEELAADGRSYALVVDEAHLAAVDLLEQIRVLTNDANLGEWLRPTILCGQTPLQKRIRGSRLTSLESRIDLNVHLRPFDSEEAHTWLKLVSGDFDRDQTEAWHRDSLGNPARLLRFSRGTLGQSTVSTPSRLNDAVNGSGSMTTSIPNAVGGPIDPPASPLVPTVPPLQIEEGVIEVGWVGADLQEPSVEPSDLLFSDMRDLSHADQMAHQTPATRMPGSVELIHDPYAALQAWEEWNSAVAGFTPSPSSPVLDPSESQTALDLDELGAEPEESSGSRAEFWSDAAERFAPYGNLFNPRTSASSEETDQTHLSES